MVNIYFKTFFTCSGLYKYLLFFFFFNCREPVENDRIRLWSCVVYFWTITNLSKSTTC